MYRILIVEDDFDISELLQSWLTEAGYQTAEAEDGLKALEVFESGQFDLVLLDLMLPRLDGFGVCEWIRKRSDVPIVMLTALDGEVRVMEQGLQTVVGSGGVRLSGGQAQRLALARTLAHPRPVLVLDDPFSALDRQTEDEVFARLKACAQDRIVILISHRLYHFPELRQIVFMQGGKADVGTHEALCASVPAYRALYESQTGGAAHEA